MYKFNEKNVITKNKKIFVFIQKKSFIIFKPYYCLLIGIK